MMCARGRLASPLRVEFEPRVTGDAGVRDAISGNLLAPGEGHGSRRIISPISEKRFLQISYPTRAVSRRHDKAAIMMYFAARLSAGRVRSGFTSLLQKGKAPGRGF